MSNNENFNHNSKNKSIINNKPLDETELKLGEYFLTPLESFIINKSMPHGYKLELFENLTKFSDIDSKERKNNNKKNKNLIKSSSNTYNHNHNNHNNKLNHKKEKKEYHQPKKRINQELDLDNNYGDININREKYKIAKKCKIGMERIKDSTFANNFYEFNDAEIPSLSKVEKKLNNYEYESLYDFEMDIRKIWSYFFYLGEKGDKDIYEKTSKMSEKWENICQELENYNDDMHERLSNSVIRRAEKNKKESLELKQKEKEKNGEDNINGFKNNNINNKELSGTMSREEKNRLGILIQNNLNRDQLKVIAKKIMGKDNIKVLEFDLDNLPYDKLLFLKKYVNECVEKNNKNGNNLKNKNNNLNNKQNIKGKENEINNKEIENKKIDEKKEQTKNENNEIKNEIKNGVNKNKEIENNNINEKKAINSLSRSDSDSLSSDSSLSD